MIGILYVKVVDCFLFQQKMIKTIVLSQSLSQPQDFHFVTSKDSMQSIEPA